MRWVATRRRAAVLGLSLLVLAGCASGGSGDPATEDTASATTSEAAGLSGTYEVSGRELYLECSDESEGEPTIVLEVGEGRLIGDLDVLRTALGPERRVCSYDRGNKGRSGPAPTPRTGEDLVGDLHGLLAAAEVPGPYVLVGHSAGGILVQAYAAAYPDEVAGVVALNPVPPWKEWSASAMRDMSATERQDEAAYMEGANGESLHYRSVSEVIEGHPVPRDIPFRLVISTIAQCPVLESVCGRTYADYERIEERVARRWELGDFTEVEASHELYADATDEVVAAIEDVLSETG